MNAQTGWNLTPVQAKEQMLHHFPHLKRWKETDKRTLEEKAADLLAQCENVTVASVDDKGYPRPVQMSKIAAVGFSEVWMATSAASMKVNDFKQNDKAGLCYEHYGDGDWFIHHFPGGPTDPDYVLLRFVGSEATFWINGEFAHSKL